MGTLWPKNWKKLSFLLVTVPFLHIESSVIPPLKAFYEGLHFFFLQLWAMNNTWGHYDLKAWKFDDLTVLCAVWFTLSVPRDFFLKLWVDQHLLTFKVNVKVKLESFNCCLQQEHSSYYYYYYYYYSVFSESPFARENLRNCNAFSHQTSHTCRPLPLIVHLIFFERIRITILDPEPNPCFQIFLNISKPYHRIFNCNTSKRRSGQELPFIFFELRAPTCLWGRYDSKTENFILFYPYLLHIQSLSKTFCVRVKSYPRATFHVLVAKVYVVTGAHYVT